MEADRWLLELLREYDRALFIRWNSRTNRWELWRKNTVETGRPPHVIRVIQYDDGSYMPLDRRLIRWLHENDMSRKWGARDKRYWALLAAKEIEVANAKFDAKRQKAWDEKRADYREDLAFGFRKDLRIDSPVPRTARKGRKPGVRTLISKGA